MRLWRALPVEREAAIGEEGGALWFPREQQGAGRHDNPERYGCIYAAEQPVSALAEQLAPFRGSGALVPAMLVRAGRPLALAELELLEGAGVVDLDDPAILVAEGLRPSLVATRRRKETQAQAARIHAAQPEAAALRWWSTLEASWINWTLFDRAAAALALVGLEALALDHPAVGEAAEFLGLTLP